MKKLVSLTLAAAMVMSLASVAFAATTPVNLQIGTQHYGEADNQVSSAENNAEVEIFGYGDMVLYPIAELSSSDPDGAATAELGPDTADFENYEMAKKLKVKESWEQHPELVSKTYISKKKHETLGGYGYYITIETKDIETTAKQDIIGTLKLSGSNITFGKGATNTKNEVSLPVAITLGYGYAAEIAPKGTTSIDLRKNTKYIFKFGKSADTGVTDDKGTVYGNTTLVEDEEFEINLQGGVGRFVVDTFGQGSVLFGNSVKYNEGFEKKIPDANYVYVNGNGAVFNKIGWLYLNALPTDVIYQVVNDKFVKINAEYDTVEEAYVFKTRALGKYVIAEKELDLEVVNAEVVEEGTEGPVVEVPGVEVPKIENPGTGAAC